MKISNKEYWINVYMTRNGKIWYGLPFPFRQNRNFIRRDLIYRIHVRLK